MSVYMFGAIEIHDRLEYAKYVAGASAAMAAFEGAEVLSVDPRPEMLEGSQPANYTVLIRFVSAEQVHAFHGSPAYRAVIGHRHAAADTRCLMIMHGLGGVN